MSYLGAKSLHGVWQRIICQMRPHDTYIEPFFGSGQIFHRKRLAVHNVIIDADAGVLGRFGVTGRRTTSETTLAANGNSAARIRAIAGDALTQLATLKPTLTECLWCNFPEPTELHDWRFIGRDYRERLDLKRFATRFLTRLDAMPALKRNFILNMVHQRQFDQ